MQTGDAKELHTRQLSAGLQGVEAVEAAWQAVRDDASPANWVAFTYAPGGSREIVEHARGEDGAEGVAAMLAEASATVIFGALRATVSGGQTRFYQFMVVGSAVGGMQRGKASLHKNGVFNCMSGCSGELSLDPFSDEENLTEENVLEALRMASGDADATAP